MAFRLNHICAPCLFRRSYSGAVKSALPSHPPPSGFAKLTPSRQLILVHGIDAPKYLQGVTTINIPSLTGKTGAYTAFLTAQGRVLFDVFIYPTNFSSTWRESVSSPDDPGFIIECDSASVPRLVSHIKRYKLRSKFLVRTLKSGEWDAWSAWDSASSGGYDIGCQDSRAPDFGRRLILPNDQRPQTNGEEVGIESYKLRRILHGIPEGQQEIVEGSALPQESCMDYMGGIDFRKGCYVGQELTIRTHHTGVVRKRILPVQLYPLDSQSQPESLTYDAMSDIQIPSEQVNISRLDRRGRSAGKFLGGVGNVGLALCRLETMTNMKLTAGAESTYSLDDEFKIEWESDGQEKGVKVKAFIPGWHMLGNQSASTRTPVSNTPLSEGY